jgi:hypothetical protein
MPTIPQRPAGADSRRRCSRHSSASWRRSSRRHDTAVEPGGEGAGRRRCGPGPGRPARWRTRGVGSRARVEGRRRACRSRASRYRSTAPSFRTECERNGITADHHCARRPPTRHRSHRPLRPDEAASFDPSEPARTCRCHRMHNATPQEATTASPARSTQSVVIRLSVHTTAQAMTAAAGRTTTAGGSARTTP